MFNWTALHTDSVTTTNEIKEFVPQWNQNHTNDQVRRQSNASDDSYELASTIRTIWGDPNSPTTFANANNSYGAPGNGGADLPTSSSNVKRGNNNNNNNTNTFEQSQFAIGAGVVKNCSGKLSSSSSGVMNNPYAPAHGDCDLTMGRAIISRNGARHEVNLQSAAAQQRKAAPKPVMSFIRDPMTYPVGYRNILNLVQQLVVFGFLDAKLFSIPIPLDMYDLIQMLAFYAKEYCKIRNYQNFDVCHARFDISNPAITADTNTLIYKINLVRNEIMKIYESTSQKLGLLSSVHSAIERAQSSRILQSPSLPPVSYQPQPSSNYYSGEPLQYKMATQMAFDGSGPSSLQNSINASMFSANDGLSTARLNLQRSYASSERMSSKKN